MKKVIIIGAGISGLTTAYWLKKNGLEVKVFEKNPVAGGSIGTEISGGYMIEHGPNSTLETTPLINKLLEDLGIINEKIYATDEAKKRYILRGGKLFPLPMGPVSILSTKLFSASAKLRLLKEPFIKSLSHEKETIAEFTRRRLGDEFLDYAINPFVAGVFAGNPENLNVKTAFPKLYELERNYGGLIVGALKSARARRKSAEKSKQSAKTISFRNGMQELTNIIYEKLKNDILTNTEVLSVGISGDKQYFTEYLQNGNKRKEISDAIVLSSPAHVTTNIIRSIDESLANELKDIYYPPVNVIFTGFKKENVGFNLDGFGYLIPSKENRKILGTLWNSILFPGRAPEGSYALTSFIGGSRNPELTETSDDEQLKITLGELVSILGVKGEPDFVKIIRWKKAIPQYNLDYASTTEMIEKFHNANPALRICSNYFKGISVSDCIKNADETVNSLLSYFNKSN
jgi:protoporphyrinogen/coproporphyrinogen III oxidase